MFEIKTFVRTAAVIAIARYVYVMYKYMGYDTKLVYNDDSCRLLNPEMVASEDLSLSKNGDVLFVTQGDLHNLFQHGPNAVASGHIYAWREGESRAEIVDIKGFPKSFTFQPHGMYVSKTTDLLYAINHLGAYSQVEVFDILYDTHSVSLKYRRSIRDDTLFPTYGINDVVEGSSMGEVYITQWLPFGLPVGGAHHAHTFQEMTLKNLMAQLIITGTTGIPMTNIFRCNWNIENSSESAHCELATPRKFVTANGITTNDDRTRIFVVDLSTKQVVVFRRDPEAHNKSESIKQLVFDHIIDLPYAVDNIEYQSNGDLLMGSIPLLHVATDAKGPQDPVPGGMLVASPVDNDQKYVVTHSLIHDGTKLSHISSTAKFNGGVVMGSPYANGILFCPSS